MSEAGVSASAGAPDSLVHTWHSLLGGAGVPETEWALVSALALGLALLLDWRFGEPPLPLHPVVWMGRYLGWAGRRVAPLTTADPPPHVQKRRSFWLGALAWCVGAGGAGRWPGGCKATCSKALGGWLRRCWPCCSSRCWRGACCAMKSWR